MVENAWEPIDWRNGRNEAHDFFGVFGTYDYSPQPCAVFWTREEAEAWVKTALAADELPPDSDSLCVSLCREGADGRLWVWNSFKDAPDGLASDGGAE